MTELSEPDFILTSRFKYLDKPNLLPGKCSVCGSPDRPVIDFGLTLEFYGTVFLCTECLNEASRVLAFYAEEPQVVQSPPAAELDLGLLNDYLLNASRANDAIASMFGSASSIGQTPSETDASGDGSPVGGEPEFVDDTPDLTYEQPELTFDEGSDSVPTNRRKSKQLAI